MKNIKYNKSIADKISVKGTVNEDALSIVYETDDGSNIIDIRNCLRPFVGEEISLTVSARKDQDCTDDLTSEDNDD